MGAAINSSSNNIISGDAIHSVNAGSAPCAPQAAAQSLIALVSQQLPTFWDTRPQLLFEVWAAAFRECLCGGGAAAGAPGWEAMAAADAVGVARCHLAPLAEAHPQLLQRRLKVGSWSCVGVR
jgi:hypothetical protein